MEMRRKERDPYPEKKENAGKRSHVTELQKGQEFDVEISQLGHSGDGMVKIEGYTVFIKNTEIGDKVRIRIKKVKETVAFADRLT